MDPQLIHALRTKIPWSILLPAVLFSSLFSFLLGLLYGRSLSSKAPAAPPPPTPEVSEITSTYPTSTPPSAQLLPTINWQTANNSTISLKYPGDIYTTQTSAKSIQLISKSTPTNHPDFLVYSYDGGSRRVWYNNFYSYSPGEVEFTEKQLGPVSALYALYVQLPASNDNYLISSGKTIILVVPQGADTQILETIISTIKFAN